ncbi:MAG: 2-oxo-4-hydroxy-4-carboxy-5-ureidoimidazoline decarboxylase [Alphaproteobacteria bacterium]|nr:2-oxo-4-hydroxy-4-carboxy-5-ureidoimidazoline decarboxylase [Alphaproteobacteria bacterium]MCW5744554.1 2-oxo-4-hydroxy-4-carboxy-5-ureidoimidazoline decarboxylase [Alphaproteobacteria bacterium]
MTLTLDQLNAMPRDAFVAALGSIFEHAPWVADGAASKRPFSTVAELHRAMLDVVDAASVETQTQFLRGHPDLAGKAARAGALTADSTAEQAGAGLDRLSEPQYARFHQLNAAYTQRFGIPFIVCVRRHTRSSILRQFERRLANDAAIEHATALGEIGLITRLRLDGAVDGPGKANVNGRLSTHVLDTHIGRPAEGVRIDLCELQDDGPETRLASAITNADGRTDKPLVGDQPLRIGVYELRFNIGAYFARRGVPAADTPFLDIVPLRFGIAEPEGHYHVPLLATPWSYSTYRGS